MMKTVLLLCCASFIGALARPSDFPFDEEKEFKANNYEYFFDSKTYNDIKKSIELKNKILYPTDYPVQPTKRPTVIYPSSTVSTTFNYPTTSHPTTTDWPTTTISGPTTTTSRPTTTTSRPTTTTRKTPHKNPQIFRNAIGSLQPFASRLTNVVANRQGVQTTIQNNTISYNVPFLKILKRLAEEGEE